MKKDIIILFLFSTLLALSLLRPYTLHLGSGVLNAIDPLFYSWNLAHNASAALRGFSGALDTNMFYPLTNTIAYSDTLWAQSIFTNPIIWITGNSILAQNLAILISFPLSAGAMYMLAMYLTKNKIASFISSIMFAFSYPRLSQIGHLPTIWNQWLPLYILALVQYLDSAKRKHMILLFIWYILAISSSIYFGVFLIPITVLVLIPDFVRRMQTKTLRSYAALIKTAIPYMLPFVVILFVALFPYIRLKVENPEIKRSVDDLTNLRANPVDYASVLPTSSMKYLLKTNINEHVLYPTLTLLFFALLGIIVADKRKRYYAYMFILISVASYILSLGNEQSFSLGSLSTGTLKMPYYYLYKWVPIFQIVRVPARFGIFVILSLCALASFGISKIYESKKYIWILPVLLSLFIVEIWQTNTPFVSIPSQREIPLVYEWIKQLPEPVALTEVPISLFYHGDKMESQLYRSYSELKQGDVYALETFRIYFSTFHHKKLLNGYSGFLPASYNHYAEILEDFPSEYSIKTIRDIGITHVIVHLSQYEKLKRAELTSLLASSPLLTKIYEDNDDQVYKLNKKIK